MKVEMYTITVCPYCVRAKNILKNQGVTEIIEYNIEKSVEFKREFLDRTNRAKTVPQIFINDKLIGGCQELTKLKEEGKLDALLGK